jgi:ribonuclease P protein component
MLKALRLPNGLRQRRVVLGGNGSTALLDCFRSEADPPLSFVSLPSVMRFSAEQHLCRPGDIRAVREQGRRVECRAFTLWWKRRDASPATHLAAEPAPAANPKSARVCVIASTAAVGNAVRRNRAKRRLREIFRQQQDVVPSDCDLLLIARRAVIDCPMAELKTRFADACEQISQPKDPA